MGVGRKKHYLQKFGSTTGFIRVRDSNSREEASWEVTKIVRKEHIDQIILIDVRELISSYFIKLDSVCRYDLRKNQASGKQAEYITRKANEMKQELNDFIDKQVKLVICDQG